MTATRTPEDEIRGASDCWCCGMIESPEKMVRLGNHPEVTICVRCAYSIKNWAWEIEDQSRTGPAVRARDWFRRLRRDAVRRGWHRSRWIGRPVRWLGRRLP
jgi:hypothetical protein